MHPQPPQKSSSWSCFTFLSILGTARILLVSDPHPQKRRWNSRKRNHETINIQQPHHVFFVVAYQYFPSCLLVQHQLLPVRSLPHQTRCHLAAVAEISMDNAVVLTMFYQVLQSTRRKCSLRNLVGGWPTPLKIWKSVGVTVSFPTYGGTKKCSKPPTRNWHVLDLSSFKALSEDGGVAPNVRQCCWWNDEQPLDLTLRPFWGLSHIWCKVLPQHRGARSEDYHRLSDWEAKAHASQGLDGFRRCILCAYLKIPEPSEDPRHKTFCSQCRRSAAHNRPQLLHMDVHPLGPGLDSAVHGAIIPSTGKKTDSR